MGKTRLVEGGILTRKTAKVSASKAPLNLPRPVVAPPDAITQEVIELVNLRFPDHPGDLKQFIWPVTPKQAEQALDQFIKDCLPTFGRFQDAMWTDEPTLFHSLLGSPINLRLLDPRKVIRGGRESLPRRQSPPARSRGFHPANLGLARICSGNLSFTHARIP